jgi:hypothetical protein
MNIPNLASVNHLSRAACSASVSDNPTSDTIAANAKTNLFIFLFPFFLFVESRSPAFSSVSLKTALIASFPLGAIIPIFR